jgi:hypothetical protein
MLGTDTAKKAFLKSTWAAAVVASDYKVVYCDYHPLVHRIGTFVRAAVPSGSLHMMLKKTHLKSVLGTRNEQACPEATWRSMFITYPPIQQAVMTLQISSTHIRKKSHMVWRCRSHEPKDTTLRVPLGNPLGIPWSDVLYGIANRTNSYGSQYKTVEKGAAMPPQRWMKHLPKDIKVVIRPESSELMGFPSEAEAMKFKRWVEESSSSDEDEAGDEDESWCTARR